MIRVPLLRSARSQEVVAYALVDDVDIWVTEQRWVLNMYGYARGTLRDLGLMHRHILGLARNDGKIADHINRDRLDNRRQNLRIVTLRESAQNREYTHGSSRYRNVSWCDGVWTVTVKLHGQIRYLGSYGDEREAAKVAAVWRQQHMPFAEVDHELIAYEPPESTRRDKARPRRKTHCHNGHLFDEENSYWDPSGRRDCRTCRREASRRVAERKRAAKAAA